MLANFRIQVEIIGCPTPRSPSLSDGRAGEDAFDCNLRGSAGPRLGTHVPGTWRSMGSDSWTSTEGPVDGRNPASPISTILL